jgi:cobaltochelatase CobN
VGPEWKGSLRDKILTQLRAGARWIADLRASAALELTNFVRALHGEYLPSGPSGDPLRAPAALPSGRNLHDFDPSLIPTPAACELGKKLANQLLEEQRRRTGKYPEKVSLVLWYGETIRHQGAMECQALYLMGVEPQWNSRGVVDGLRLIPESELGRPRVDVVITVAGIYRDGFPDKMLLLDRAARLVQQAGDNALSRNTRRIAEQLRRQGVAADVAEKAASARIFGPAPGDYGAGIANLIKQSRDAGNTDLIVEAYLRHNNFAYGEQVWGEAVPHALASHLKGNEVVVHSRSTNLYGVTDNDDFFDFAGGLNLATKVVNGGRPPEFYVANLRARGRERLQDFRAFLAAEVNSRFWNPKWIRQMQAAGYSGAREIADQLENLYGWQATTPDKVGSAYWERTYQVYVEDRHGLGLREFFDKQNPHARQLMLARLLEVDRQGSYRFAPEQRARLLAEYARSIARFGIACSANTCGNRRLLAAVLSNVRSMRVLNAAELGAFRQRLREAVASVRPAGGNMVGRARAGPGRIRRVNSNPLSLIEVPMPRFDRVEVIIPFGLALFGLFLASSGSLGALQALWLRRRGANLETLKL